MQLTAPRKNYDPAFPGMLADTMFKRTVSRAVGTAGPFAPGVFVAEDVNGVIQPLGTASTVYSGVAQHDHALVGSLIPGTTVGAVRGSPMWYATEAMSVLQRGAIWVLVATGSIIARNSPVSALNTAVAERGYATQAGAANSVAVVNAMAISPIYTLADGRRIIQVELHAGNAA